MNFYLFIHVIFLQALFIYQPFKTHYAEFLNESVSHLVAVAFAQVQQKQKEPNRRLRAIDKSFINHSQSLWSTSLRLSLTFLPCRSLSSKI